MSEAVSVLRKKTAPAKAVVPGGASVSAMLKKLMPRVADQAMALDVLVGAVNFGTADKSDVLAQLGDNDLVYLMEDDEETRAICVVTPGLLAALIEKQVSGRVSETEPPDRVATRTDGIVASDIVDRWISGAEMAAVEGNYSDVLVFAGFKRLDRVLNKRNTDLSLDPVNFRTLSVELSLEGGAKTGSIYFAAPKPKLVALDAASSKNRIHKHLADIEAPMTAILTRIPVPIERVKKLAVDDVIDVPISALLNVQLEGLNGQRITHARLGQLNGNKAVRLSKGTNDGEAPANLGVLGATQGSASSTAMAALPEPSMPSDRPGLAELPGGEPEAGLPAANDLPDLPDFPGNEGMGEMPSLEDGPDLPDLPDLPELPDLPDLPS